MAADTDELRRRLRDLFERRASGDLPDRHYQRQVTETAIELCRELVKARLESGEELLADHHVVHSHFKLSQSLLDEPEQVAASFFATNRRLIRVRGVIVPTRPMSYDDADQTVIDDLSYADMASARMRRSIRWSEAAAGLLFAGLALLLRGILAVTGPLLVLFGVLGICHAVLLPTRCFVIVAGSASKVAPFEIYGVRRRGARAIIRLVRHAIREGSPRIA